MLSILPQKAVFLGTLKDGMNFAEFPQNLFRLLGRQKIPAFPAHLGPLC